MTRTGDMIRIVPHGPRDAWSGAVCEVLDIDTGGAVLVSIGGNEVWFHPNRVESVRKEARKLISRARAEESAKLWGWK